MEIPENTRKCIMKYLGVQTDVFFSKVDPMLEKYKSQWRISRVSFMPTNTVNLLFECDSEYYGNCVLKMCIPGPEAATEINCLRAYDGHGYVKLWAYDLSDDILLLERVIPGSQMWTVTDYRERARLMAHRVKDLPVPWDGKNDFP